jgi:hypothetical protein
MDGSERIAMSDVTAPIDRPQSAIFSTVKGESSGLRRKAMTAAKSLLLVPTKSDKIARRKTRANEIDRDNTDAVRQQQRHNINGVQVDIRYCHGSKSQRCMASTSVSVRRSEKAALDCATRSTTVRRCFALTTENRRRLLTADVQVAGGSTMLADLSSAVRSRSTVKSVRRADLSRRDGERFWTEVGYVEFDTWWSNDHVDHLIIHAFQRHIV